MDFFRSNKRKRFFIRLTAVSIASRLRSAVVTAFCLIDGDERLKLVSIVFLSVF